MATHKKIRISGNLMVLNEIHNIPIAIRNLFEFCDEIVILDGGSTDGTIEYVVSLHDPRIKLYIWPQENGSIYNKGWDEPRRRTLMMRMSDGDYILCIDADECVEDTFVDFIKRMDSDNIVCFFSTLHFWKKPDWIRVNAGDDRVWYPNYHHNLFPNNESFSWFSYREDKMHPKLVKRVLGINIPIGLRYIYFSKFLTPLLKVIAELILGVKIVVLDDIHVFHYHYLNGFKAADLRLAEKDKKEELVEVGDHNSRRNGAVLVKRINVRHPKAFYENQ
ncbi:MAG: glycosyltransferase [Patescibacteria group bacterium]|nr:glycosyltransferase [Patescibacteria group bacterium]MCL5224324.1 glycosyltransferase [Patescibacteria group bacterium]